MLAGLDDKGTIHTLSFSKGKWVDRDYRNAFMPGANLAMKHITRESIIVAHNGTAVAAVRVGDKAKLDALLTIDLAVRYDSPKVSINETSLVAAMKADQTLVAGRDQEHALGKAHAEAPVPFAIAENADIVGWMSADGRLHAADLSGNRLRITTPAHSPKPSELPSGMVWSRDGSILVVTFPNGTWLWARRLGF